MLREIQAKNMAKEILKHGNKIKFLMNLVLLKLILKMVLISSYVKYQHHTYWPRCRPLEPQDYVLVHQGDKPMEDVYNFDPWNNYGN